MAPVKKPVSKTAVKKIVAAPKAVTAAATKRPIAKAPAGRAMKQPLASSKASVKKAAPVRAAGARPKRKPLPIFKAPQDFKPHFLLVQIATERDGLLASNISAVRYQGRFDREADDKKKSNMAAYDMPTLIGIQARLAAVTYKANADKKMPATPAERAASKGAMRLPASAIFQVLLRVGKKAADQALTTRVVQVFQAVENPKTGRKGLKTLEKTDIAYRALRKASRILPAAFKAVQMPPKRGRKVTDEE